MALKNGVNGLNVDAMPIADVYAAWGTTEEAHLEKMFAIIDSENAKVKGTTRRQVGGNRFADVRVAASRPAAAGRLRFQGSRFVVKKLKGLGDVTVGTVEGFSPAVAETLESTLKRVAGKKKAKTGKAAKGMKGYKGIVLKAAKKKK